jgi:SSS family solute:Na+ symporter
LISKNGGDSNDTNYIFLRFVVDFLPVGLVGLLIAIIFLASWGSIAAALNSLASCTVVDFHKRYSKRKESAENDYRISRWYTFGWGIFSIIVAMFAYDIGNSLIETVNILGSLFYGVILGVFLIAFYFKQIKGNATFWAAIIVQIFILFSTLWTKLPRINFLYNAPTGAGKAIDHFMSRVNSVGFLWLNVIGAVGVVLLAFIIHLFALRKANARDQTSNR